MVVLSSFSANIGPLHRSNNKQVDLTRTFRLSGLPSGAKLDLTQLSRSPSAVSVALQLPETEAKGLSSSRLTEKFSSGTSLWQLLRAFESGKIPGTGVAKNFTARGVPHTASGKSGAGRLWQEAPVVHIMGRDYTTFTDLQKSLAQLGFNDGSVLLKLSFKTTDTPLEEAMELIDKYFSSANKENEPAGAHARDISQTQSKPVQDQPAGLEEVKSPASPEAEPSNSPGLQITPNGQTETDLQLSTSAAETSTAAPTTLSNITFRPTQVFSKPNGTTPRAALQSHNEADYVPSPGLMKSHQSGIVASTRNKRLPTDAEVAAQEKAQAEKLKSIQEVSIKIVLPDETSVQSTFSASDTAAALYEHIRSLLARRDEPFTLRYNTDKGPRPMQDGDEKLIGKLKLTGKVLVRMQWADGASLAAKQVPSLRKEVADQAREIEVKTFAGAAEEGSSAQGSKALDENTEKQNRGNLGMKTPKWLKGLGGRR